MTDSALSVPAAETAHSMARPRWRTLVVRLGSAAALLGSFLLSAEVFSRLDDYFREDIPLTAVPDGVRDLIVRDSIGVRGKPNGHYKRWRLNSAGFRSSEAALTPVPGCIRVMTIGTSETYGGVAEAPGKEYPAQLNDSLKPTGCYQILNAAIVGQPLQGLIRLWNAWGSRFHPDIVVVLASPGSYLEAFPQVVPKGGNAGGGGGPAPEDPWWTPRFVEKAHDFIHYPDFINRWRVQRRLAGMTAGKPAEWYIDSVPQDHLDEYRRDMDSIVTSIRAHGARVVVATYPDRFGGTARPEDEELLSAWRQYWPKARPAVMLAFMEEGAERVRQVGRCRGAPVADLSRVIGGHREWFDDFVHYTETGAGVVAGEVARAVRQAQTDTLVPGAQPGCP